MEGGGQWVKGTGMARRKRSRLLCKLRGMPVLRLMIPISCKYLSHHFFLPFSPSPLPLSSPSSSLSFSPFSQEASTQRPHIPPPPRSTPPSHSTPYTARATLPQSVGLSDGGAREEPSAASSPASLRLFGKVGSAGVEDVKVLTHRDGYDALHLERVEFV